MRQVFQKQAAHLCSLPGGEIIVAGIKGVQFGKLTRSNSEFVACSCDFRLLASAAFIRFCGLIVKLPP
jgi:hypothetical protein